MEKEAIASITQAQRTFFNTGATLPVKQRIKHLRTLYDVIAKREDEIACALNSDLGKSAQEAYMCEIGMVLSEIRHFIKYTKKYARRRKARTPLAQFPARSFVLPCPYGNVLIMSPWNYPFLLTLDPLVCAIAAGNTVTVKPSAYSPATSIVQRSTYFR